MTQFNKMQEVKHRLYAMRNGAVADYMRRMGAPYKIIFGVNLPHLSEIASETVPSQELASANILANGKCLSSFMQSTSATSAVGTALAHSLAVFMSISSLGNIIGASSMLSLVDEFAQSCRASSCDGTVSDAISDRWGRFTPNIISLHGIAAHVQSAARGQG